MANDLESAGLSAMLGAHELVLLHGQPGSAADWVQVAARLPPQLHAVAADRPGYGSSELPAAGFAANARAVLDDLDARSIQRAVLVGHSYGGGVALSAASLAPHRVEAVVLLASVGPGCVNGWDRLLAAPGAGELCALVAWGLTPWIARARLARIARRRGRPLRPDEHVNWSVWGHASASTARCGAPSWPSSAPCCANWTNWSPPSLLSRRRYCCSPTHRITRCPSIPAAGWRRRCRTLACSSSRGPVITYPDAPPVPSPTR
jgi:pimeloyl-ACP methyl ester carboxylesterase